MWNMGQWCTTLTPELTRRSQLDLYESKAHLVYKVSSRRLKDYIVRLCLKKIKQKQRNNKRWIVPEEQHSRLSSDLYVNMHP